MLQGIDKSRRVCHNEGMEYAITVKLTGRDFSRRPTDQEVFDLLSEILVPGTSPEYRNEELLTPEAELLVEVNEFAFSED